MREERKARADALKGQNINYWYNDYRTESATYYWEKQYIFTGRIPVKIMNFVKRKKESVFNNYRPTL